LDRDAGEDAQTKGIENLFNKIIAEKFNLEKERAIQVQGAFRLLNRQD
jgi:hypothetical protein